MGGKTMSKLPEKPVPTPEGAPETVRPTLPLKPFTGVTLILSVPPAFCCSMKGFTAAASVKPGAFGAAMTNFTVTLLENGFELPEPGAAALITMG